MTIQDQIGQVRDRFNKFNNWEDKYRELIVFGKELDQLEEKYWIDKFLVKGCQSKVWLRPEYKDGKVFFSATSDAVLVRGIIGLIVSVYSGHEPDEILKTKPDFLKDIGITEHLSMNRTNGLSSMLKQVQMYAFAFKSLADKGIKNAGDF